MLGSLSAWALNCLAVKLFSKNSNQCDHGTWSRTDGQTTTCNLVTALCVASRGKKIAPYAYAYNPLKPVNRPRIKSACTVPDTCHMRHLILILMMMMMFASDDGWRLPWLQIARCIQVQTRRCSRTPGITLSSCTVRAFIYYVMSGSVLAQDVNAITQMTVDVDFFPFWQRHSADGDAIPSIAIWVFSVHCLWN